MTSNDPDIRKSIQDSRGLLKKIQLVIPGFRGYRELDDIRVADELLRAQISKILSSAEQDLNQFRSQLVRKGEFSSLEGVASAISRLQQLRGKVMNAEQVYSGISPAIRVGEETLNKLYEYDFNFLDAARKLEDVCNKTVNAQGGLEAVLSSINTFTDAWQKRTEAVEGILQK
jgi:DNA repair ATPase RecN